METNRAIKILEYRYDGVSNKTHARVEHADGTDWIWISGYLSEHELPAFLSAYLERNAEVAPCS